MKWRTLGVAALIMVFAALAVGSGGVGAGDIVTLDDEHDLTTTSEIDSYESDGVATAEVTFPDLTLTVAEESADVGLDGWSFDRNKRYLRVEYHESVDRTIRFFVPSEYWHPSSAEIESLDGNATAELRPTNDGRYTAVTVDVSDGDDLVFEVPKETSFVFWTRDRTRDTINETLGYEPPRVSTGGEWHYIDRSELSNTTVPVDSSDGVTIQYNAAEDDEDDRWRSVPRCTRGQQEVCTYTVDGKDDQTMVLSQTSEPPEVRYKPGSDPVENVSSSLGELRDIPGDVLEDVRGLLGFNSGGDDE